MDKYTFNHSGTQLLELVMIVLSNICDEPWVADSFFYAGANLSALNMLDSRIYSNQQDFAKLADSLIQREHGTITDAQKIVTMFQNTDDLEGQKFLLNIIKGVDKRKIVGNEVSFDLQMSKLYHGFLYKNGRADLGFRLNNPEINKFLLMQVLEFTNPDVEKDFKVLVDNAESFGVNDEDIEKIYKRLEQKYNGFIATQQGTRFDDSITTRKYRLEQMQKSFAPIQERIEIKKQQAPSEMDENISREELLAELKRLRAENKKLKEQNTILQGILKAQEMAKDATAPTQTNIYQNPHGM